MFKCILELSDQFHVILMLPISKDRDVVFMYEGMGFFFGKTRTSKMLGAFTGRRRIFTSLLQRRQECSHLTVIFRPRESSKQSSIYRLHDCFS
jgi:hypothetical protein